MLLGLLSDKEARIVISVGWIRTGGEQNNFIQAHNKPSTARNSKCFY
jgi:hypothetical protein